MIAKWILVVFLAFYALGKIALIGKPVKPITPESALGSIVATTIAIITIVIWWH